MFTLFLLYSNMIFLSLVLLAVRLHAAWKSPILDCDEVFNYWEPLNFLIRSFGKQTWEYDPVFAIRSYAYLWPWTLLKFPLTWLNLPPFSYFFLIRFILALLFTLTEINLSKQLKSFNNKMPYWFLLSQIASPGMYSASVSLLPNSMALLFTMFSTSYIIRYFNSITLMNRADNDLVSLEKKVDSLKSKTSKSSSDDDLNVEVLQFALKSNHYSILYSLMSKFFTLAILTISIAGFACWPFSLVLILPFASFALLNSVFSGPYSIRLKQNYKKKVTFLTLFLTGLSCAFFVPYFISQLDYLFYKTPTIYFYNLIHYNVFNSDNLTGPNIFGTEDLLYYIKNLILNFHFMFPLALINLVLLPTWPQLISYKLPLIIWAAIFFSQPHKEERFLYPIYHLISISFAQLMSCQTFKLNPLLKFFKLIINLVITPLLLLFSVLRISNVVNSYSTPIELFKLVSDLNNGENVCIGREWYHYPSSFFLNSNQRLKFTKSNFNGLLPGDFIENDSSAIFTHVDGLFNNENKFQSKFIIDPVYCDYFIDNTYEISSDDATNLNDESINWEIIECLPMIDTQTSFGLNRILGVDHFVENYIVNPWLNLQNDASVIELNRKLMQMYGIKRDGNLMFNDLYKLLNTFWSNTQKYLGIRNEVDLCLAKRKK